LFQLADRAFREASGGCGGAKGRSALVEGGGWGGLREVPNNEWKLAICRLRRLNYGSKKAHLEEKGSWFHVMKGGEIF